MSLESWKNEFYQEMKFDNDIDVIKHSLNKYQGLLEENLTRHGVKLNRPDVFNEETTPFLTDEKNELFLSSRTCSLCMDATAKKTALNTKDRLFHYLRSCEVCLLTDHGYLPCSSVGSKWDRFCITHNPKPFIRIFKKMLKEMSHDND